MTDNSNKVVELPTLSDEAFGVLVGAFKTCYTIVHGRGRSGPGADHEWQRATLPDVSVCLADPKLLAETLERTFRAMTHKQGEAARKAVSESRAKVTTICATYIAKTLAVCAAFDANPEILTAMGAERPVASIVPVSALLGCFAKGTTPEQAVSHLKTMGYTLQKGPSTKDGSKLRIDFPKPTLTPPVGHGAAVNAEVDAEIAAENAANEAAGEDSDEAPASSVG
jgi:hypothetical protein